MLILSWSTKLMKKSQSVQALVVNHLEISYHHVILKK